MWATFCFAENVATLNAETNGSDKKPEKETVKKDDPSSQSLPKFFDVNSFATAQKRVQFLLSKLHNLLQIKVDLDQLLAFTQEFSEATSSLSKGSASAYQEMTQDIYFKIAVEKLMKKGKILEINQDVQVLLSRLRQLAHLQSSHSTSFMHLYCDDKTLSPLHSETAFLNFIIGRLPSSNLDFSCKDRPIKKTSNGHSLPVTSQSHSTDDL